MCRSQREHERDPIAEYLAQIILRLRHLDVLNEMHGPTRGRERQFAALEWALETLRDIHPQSAERALPIADRLTRLIADGRARREELLS